MVEEKKGITGITEEVRGFVGLYPKRSQTLENKDKLTFTLSAGINNPDKLLFSTWRKCIAYGDIARELIKIRTGNLVQVNGWLDTQPVRDISGKPLIRDGKIVTTEVLIITYGEFMEYKRQAVQPVLIDCPVVGPGPGTNIS